MHGATIKTHYDRSFTDI